MSLDTFFNRIKHAFARSYPSGFRFLHTTKTLDLPPWSPSALLIQDLETKCHHPVFSVVRRLAAVKPDMRFRELEPMLAAERQYPDVQQWNWMSVAEGGDFEETMGRLQAAGVRVAEEAWEFLLSRDIRSSPANGHAPRPPTWLVMHILCNQARTYDEMVLVLKLVYYHLPFALPEFQPSILIMTGIRLAQFRMVAPFRQLVHHFLRLSSQLNADHLNLMIRTVALLPSSKEASLLAVGLIRLTIASRMTVTEHTFDALLSSSFIDLPVEKAARDAMAAQDFQPTVFHLRQLLKLSVTRHRSKHAARYLLALRGRLKQTDAKELPWAPVGDRWLEGVGTNDNRAFVASMKNIQSAHKVLDRAAAQKQKQRLERRRNRLNKAPTFTIEDWVAGLQVAARDHRVNPAALLKAFREGERVFTKRLRKIAYTVVIKGLVRKWAVKEAVQLWDECRAMVDKYGNGQIVDAVELGVGVTMLALNHEPHRAFKLLETVWLRQSKPVCLQEVDGLREQIREAVDGGKWHLVKKLRRELRAAQSLGGQKPFTGQTPKEQEAPAKHKSLSADLQRESSKTTIPVEPNRITHSVQWEAFEVVNLDAINSFMVSLHRTGRTDVVFALWDKMEILYGLRPDVYSLNIVIQAARWSTRYNITIRGALAHLGVGVHVEQHTFTEETRIEEREHAKRWVEELVAPGVQHVRHSLWNGQSASHRALRIVARTVLGNWPHLRSVQSPVPVVVKPSVSQTIVERLIGGRSHSLLDGNYSQAVGDKEDASEETTVKAPLVNFADELPESVTFMQIVPTDVTFRALLDLLELHNFASEVPLAMAWMRKLNIRPSKHTLATALVYWSGVPDVDRWGGRQHSYRVFYAWLVGWVGEAKMPTAREMSTTFRRIHLFNANMKEEMTAKKVERVAEKMQVMMEEEDDK